MVKKSNNENIELVRLVTAGSVDDGKSTMIGRLLFDCQAIYEDQILAVKKESKKRGFAKIDYSLFTDGLSSEREQLITIDAAYRYFSTPRRRFIITDVPGHEQYTRNMATGASKADIALILADARAGMQSQSKRHLLIASLLGIPHIAIIVNKMDLVKYNQARYEEIVNEFKISAAKMKISDLQFIPISALKGDMLVDRGKNMSWYNGATLLNYLENIQISSDRNLIDFRFPIQLVIRPNQNFRGYAGNIQSGIIKVGDKVKILPGGQLAKIKKIITGFKNAKLAFCPQPAVIELDKQIDASRGDMVVRENNIPAVNTDIEAMVCWFGHEPMTENKSYILKHTTNFSRVFIKEIRYRFNINTLHHEKAPELKMNEIGRVRLETLKPLIFDLYLRNRNTGSFILIDESTNATAAAGMIIGEGSGYSGTIQTNKDAKKIELFSGFSQKGEKYLDKIIKQKLKQRNLSINKSNIAKIKKELLRELNQHDLELIESMLSELIK